MTTLLLCNQVVIFVTLLVGFWQTYRVTRHVEAMMQKVRRLEETDAQTSIR